MIRSVADDFMITFRVSPIMLMTLLIRSGANGFMVTSRVLLIIGQAREVFNMEKTEFKRVRMSPDCSAFNIEMC